MQTTTIGAFEARRNFGKLLTDVGYKGGSIVVKKNGKKLVAIVPIDVLESWKQNRKELFDTIRQMQQEANLSPEEADKLAAERAFGNSDLSCYHVRFAYKNATDEVSRWATLLT